MSYAVFCLKKKRHQQALGTLHELAVLERLLSLAHFGFECFELSVAHGRQLDRRLYFFCNDPATTEIYTLSLHDALPILADDRVGARRRRVDRHVPPARPCRRNDG